MVLALLAACQPPALPVLADVDGDGYASIRRGGDDCNDRDPAIHPGAPEVWYDGIDSDCAGDDDYDRDGDGSPSALYGGSDCDDYDPDIRPWTTRCGPQAPAPPAPPYAVRQVLDLRAPDDPWRTWSP